MGAEEETGERSISDDMAGEGNEQRGRRLLTQIYFSLDIAATRCSPQRD